MIPIVCGESRIIYIASNRMDHPSIFLPVLRYLSYTTIRNGCHDTLNPLCTCSLEPETNNHLLLHCHHYDIQRQTLFDCIYTIDESIANLSDDNLLRLLLYRNTKLYSNEQNTKILNATVCFLKSSERFDNPLY